MDFNFFETTYRLINKYNQKSKKANYYGTDDLLYPAEVHLIDTIGSKKSITTTQLAETLSITKGAVSQTTNKLLNKGLIVKQTDPNRKNEIHITLSEKGNTVFKYHRELHKDMHSKIQNIFNNLSAENKDAFNSILEIIEDTLEEI